MMANWDLRPLERDLPRLEPTLALIVGGKDRTIRLTEARRVAASVPGATISRLPGLGDLAHEERPEEIAERIVDLARSVGLLPSS
jgi:magnesium chelatase accessory protein